MGQHIRFIWIECRDSLWFLPMVMSLLMAGLAVALVSLERLGIISSGEQLVWLAGSTGEGARSVLSAIGTSVVTVTGTVFSIMIVALQLSSSQFSPRQLRNFMSDRANQVVLGGLVGTFTYTLIVMSMVRSASPQSAPFVPQIAMALGVVLALTSIGLIVYFIDHASRAMQIAVILQQVTQQAVGQIEHAFVPLGEKQAELDPCVSEALDKKGYPLCTEQGGYLQAVDREELLKLARKQGLIVRLEHRIGKFILPGDVLALVWPAEAIDETVMAELRKKFVLGSDRTPEQDIEYWLIEMADIAIKALSPSINDPTTAFRVIDRLCEVLTILGQRQACSIYCSEDGRIRLIERPLSFELAVGLAFEQIYHFGQSNPSVLKKLAGSVTALIRLLPHERQAVLVQYSRLPEDVKDKL
ncbi:putative membrane protein [Pseudomonas duriflava]|uniref:Putative membrane protein n=1 Tax=Pseudomonas duriflava TaxID=459528 RepID=A0A562Q8D9_9PSED|nr:DUF2254 domain-containing protein [Pseudomonas duriflava]TWI53031.1 putative membrane protein [Pseudomonas duriflava]